MQNNTFCGAKLHPFYELTKDFAKKIPPATLPSPFQILFKSFSFTNKSRSIPLGLPSVSRIFKRKTKGTERELNGIK